MRVILLTGLLDKLKGLSRYHGEITDPTDISTPRKRRKLQDDRSQSSVVDWSAFKDDVRQFEVENVVDKSKFSFRFVQGPLVRAVQSGSW